MESKSSDNGSAPATTTAPSSDSNGAGPSRCNDRNSDNESNGDGDREKLELTAFEDIQIIEWNNQQQRRDELLARRSEPVKCKLCSELLRFY